MQRRSFVFSLLARQLVQPSLVALIVRVCIQYTQCCFPSGTREHLMDGFNVVYQAKFQHTRSPINFQGSPSLNWTKLNSVVRVKARKGSTSRGIYTNRKRGRCRSDCLQFVESFVFHICRMQMANVIRGLDGEIYHQKDAITLLRPMRNQRWETIPWWKSNPIGIRRVLIS